MGTLSPIELAAELVAVFVSNNNSVPTSELPALIHAVHTAVARLAGGPESAPPQIEAKAPAVPIRKSITPDFLICLEDGKRFNAASPGGARPYARAISPEMEPAVRLSYGRAQLHGAAVGDGEENRTWQHSAESRSS
jgi:hypothetical protein